MEAHFKIFIIIIIIIYNFDLHASSFFLQQPYNVTLSLQIRPERRSQRKLIDFEAMFLRYG